MKEALLNMLRDLKFVFCTMVFLAACVLRWYDKIPAPEWSNTTFWLVAGYVLGVAAVKLADGWSTQAVAKANAVMAEAKSKA